MLRGTADASAYIQVRMGWGESTAFAASFEATMSLRDATVLVVEDNPLILMSALDLVTTAGFEGVGAASADEAIRIQRA